MVVAINRTCSCSGKSVTRARVNSYFTFVTTSETVTAMVITATAKHNTCNAHCKTLLPGACSSVTSVVFFIHSLNAAPYSQHAAR